MSSTDTGKHCLRSDALQLVEGAYNALLQVQRRPQAKPLDMTDLKRSGSLKAAQALVHRTVYIMAYGGREVP